jgi:PDZ domain-containing protein
VSVLTRWFVVAAAIVALGAIPLPYYLVAPGTAVDLTHTVSVLHHRPPTDRYYLTDVTLQRASPIRLVLLLLPGVKLQPALAIAPSGMRDLDTVSTMQMETSQEAAAVVAERAAGYHVPIPAERTTVVSVDPASRAIGVLKSGDVITAVDGAPIRTSAELRTRVGAHKVGDELRIDYERLAQRREAFIPLVAFDRQPRLGIRTQMVPQPATLAVPVTYGMGEIGGPSGGLMFALEIYRTLRPGAPSPERKIAGTGTIAFDGTVGPIEGTRQKLIAAKRAGASVFLVPRENYAEIKDEKVVRVVPVDTFADALRALPG